MGIRADIENEMTASNVKYKYWPNPDTYRFIIAAPNFAEVFAAVLKCEDIITFKYSNGRFDITISGFEDEAHDLIELSKQHVESCAYIMDDLNSEQGDPAYGIAGWKFLNSLEDEQPCPFPKVPFDGDYIR